jgi:signal transduction histidine kinase
LKREIVRRHASEVSLKKSEQHSGELLEQSQRMQEQLRLLSRKVLSAQEDERKKISRELHDVIAQNLTGINVCLATLTKEVSIDPEGMERHIARTQQLVDESVNIVHRFARQLRPAVLDDLGLIPALHTFMKQFKAETGIRVGLSTFAAVEQVNGDKRTALFRVAQEALTNVARHANATKVELKIQKVNGDVCMEIIDNGKGFPPRALKNNRLGLLGMRERLEMVGGTFTLISAPCKGTTICAQVPLSDKERTKGGRSAAEKPRKTS